MVCAIVSSAMLSEVSWSVSHAALPPVACMVAPSVMPWWGMEGVLGSSVMTSALPREGWPVMTVMTQFGL